VNKKEEENMQDIIRSIKEDNAGVQIVSNRSFQPNMKKGAAAWVITMDKIPHFIFGSNITPGERDEQCSHHSELGGVIGDLSH
jgi:hypothetical protein